MEYLLLRIFPQTYGTVHSYDIKWRCPDSRTRLFPRVLLYRILYILPHRMQYQTDEMQSYHHLHCLSTASCPFFRDCG